MWGFVVLCITGVTLLAIPYTKRNDLWLGLGAISIFLGLWLDKGIGFVLAGFVPTPLDEIVEYYPTLNEIMITIAVWCTGFFVLTVLYKIAIAVEHEVEAYSLVPVIPKPPVNFDRGLFFVLQLCYIASTTC